MKHPVIYLLASFLILFFNSCSDPVESLTLPQEEVAEMAAASLAKSASGITVIIDASLHTTAAALESGDYCNYKELKMTESTSAEDAPYRYAYEYDYIYKASCTAGVARSMSTEVVFNGSFDTQRMNSRHAGTFDFTTTSLGEATVNYTVNGHYISNGKYTSGIGEGSEGNNTVEISVADVVISKADRRIVSGTANVMISGHFTDQRPFNAGAAVVFQDNNTFTITVRGAAFLVNIDTGVVTPVS